MRVGKATITTPALLRLITVFCCLLANLLHKFPSTPDTHCISIRYCIIELRVVYDDIYENDAQQQSQITIPL